MSNAYHFHAMHNNIPGVVSHVDGVFTCDSNIKTIEDYNKLKKLIAHEFGFDASKLTICSLTLL